MLKLSNSIKGALCSAVLGLIYLAQARHLDLGTARMPQEGFVPMIIAVTLLALCVALIAKEIFYHPAHVESSLPESETGVVEDFSWKRPLILMVIMVIYPLILPYFGFIAATFALVYLVLRIFEYRNHIWSLAVAAISVAVTYFIFEYWLKVLLFPEATLF